MEPTANEPARTLVLVHTVAPLIDEFNRLCGRLLPGVRTYHILDEPLLERIRRHGGGSPNDVLRLGEHIELAASIGADAVLVTCSTTSLLVDGIRARYSVPVVTIDEAMAGQAVESGPRVALVATNHTTLEPSQTLILDAAARAGREVVVTTMIVADALPALLRGDEVTHDALVARAIRAATAEADVVVLAQASMARATTSIADWSTRVPVLSSPELAIRQVAQILARPVERAGDRETARP